MKNIEFEIIGHDVDFYQARDIANIIASKDNELAMLISWCDKKKGTHSPQCLKCSIKDKPGWEVYGINHDGRLRIGFNKGEFVFIYS